MSTENNQQDWSKTEEEKTSVSNNDHLRENLKQFVDIITTRYENLFPSEDESIETHISGLTLNTGELVFVSSHLLVGKTVFVTNLISDIAIRTQQSAGILSVRNDTHYVMSNIMSSISHINRHKFRNVFFNASDWENLTYAIKRINGKPLYIEHLPLDNLSRMLEKIEAVITTHQLKVLAIDDFPVGAHNSHKAQEFVEFFSHLKQIAINNGCCLLITVDQECYCFECPDKEYRRPSVKRLAMTEEIKSLANRFILIHRDEVFNLDKNNLDADIILVTQDDVETIIKTRFFGECSEFLNAF